PNSEVKRRSVDDSVGLPHVKVENCQALIKAGTPAERPGFFALLRDQVYFRKIAAHPSATNTRACSGIFSFAYLVIF
ncbi:hypothetical protein ACGVWS_08310, partial [Enterobacteriaceae bacterium LUAb1]